MEDAVGDEKGSENIDGIVEMAEKHANSKKQRGCYKDCFQIFVLPKKESHQKWQSGMGGEKKIIR